MIISWLPRSEEGIFKGNSHLILYIQNYPEAYFSTLPPPPTSRLLPSSFILDSPLRPSPRSALTLPRYARPPLPFQVELRIY